MTARVLLHVGSPKTGTTFLQQVLWSQRARAREQGLLLPLDSFDDHFLATLDVREATRHPAYAHRASGMWGRVVEESLRHDGNVLVSHELFAGATEEQAAAAVAAFGQDAEVHVIVTARDLVRQIPAEWQEHVKHRSTEPFAGFMGRLRDRDPHDWFWQVQDFAGVLQRWGASLPTSRVHLVTVPGPGTGPEVLWSRYGSLLGLEVADYDLSGSRANTSLGYEQAELVRRVNADLGDRLPLPGPYPTEVKTVLAQTVLAGREGTKFALAAEDRGFAVEVSREIADRIAASGVEVIGDLEELVPAVVGEAPDLALHDDVLLAESVAALSGVLVEHRARRKERDEARQALEELVSDVKRRDEDRQALEDFVSDVKRRPVRHMLIGLSEKWAWLGAVRVLYSRTAAAVRARRRPRP